MYTDAYYLPDPASFLSKFTCDRIPTPETQWQGNNTPRFCDAGYDAGITELHAMGIWPSASSLPESWMRS